MRSQIHDLLTWERASIERGQRWIYSAGFNTQLDLVDPIRIDVEVSDLRALSDAGAQIAILSHKGSWAQRSAGSLAFAAKHLSKRLGRPVDYFPTNADEAAQNRACAMEAGQIVLFGNTREHEGEEACDPELAQRFARLGQYVAIGGFSKAHRSHASNIGILEYLPGFATRSLIAEFDRIERLRQPGRCNDRIGMLGGIKPEKVTKGLPIFSSLCSRVLLGGVVLNNVLRARGEPILPSALGADPERTLAAARAAITDSNSEKLILPSRVWKSRGPSIWKEDLGTSATVPRVESAVIDFEIAASTKRLFETHVDHCIQVIVAGTPSFVDGGFRHALDGWRQLLQYPHVEAFLIGGDTASDFALDVPRSTGGGSALAYLCDGTCAVEQALRRNQSNRHHRGVVS